jgi:hypothetical protein
MRNSARRLVGLSIIAGILFMPQLAQAKSFYNSEIFKAKFNGKTIYGSWNDLDNRACSVINGKAIFGKVSGDRRKVLLPGKRINVVASMPKNYAFHLKISESWLSNKQLKECTDYTSYAKCFLSAGVKYYENNSQLRKVFKSKTQVLVHDAIDNNFVDRDGVSDIWATFSFNLSESTTYSVRPKQLICENKRTSFQ